MALPDDRHFREKYRGKKSLLLQPQLLPQTQYLFKRKNSGGSLHDETLVQKISLYHGSIVDKELVDDVDAVVLPANERLWADGSGVCGAIFRAAGYDKLQKACNAITANTDDHSIPNGQTVATKAFNLPVKHILHTIAPCVQNNEDLVSCYISTLETCVKMNIRNVALPCIGTGDGNFSKQAACSIVVRTVRGWLCDANNVKYIDFMAKSKIEAQQTKWQNNVQYAEKDNNNEVVEDIFKIVNVETVFDRIDNVVFCIFDAENWDLYQQIIPKIFPTSIEKHSYLWIDKIRSLEYKCMLHHIQGLEMENKQLKSGTEQQYMESKVNDPEEEVSLKANNLPKLWRELVKKKQEFTIFYTEEKIKEMITVSPKSLITINKEMLSTLNCLDKIKEVNDDFIDCVSEINAFVSKVSVPNPKKYVEWTVDDIIVWILSLENGRFSDHIDQIKDGLIASEISCGDTLTELTRSDLSVPPFNINSFKVKKDLIGHFQSLKKGDNDKNFEGDNTLGYIYTHK